MSEYCNSCSGPDERGGTPVIQWVEDFLGLPPTIPPEYTTDKVVDYQGDDDKQRYAARVFMSKMGYYLEPYVSGRVKQPEDLAKELLGMYKNTVEGIKERPDSRKAPFELEHVAGEAEYHVRWFEAMSVDDGCDYSSAILLYATIRDRFAALAGIE